ncbi:MAG: ATP synthase F1 subunit delta [Flavobacteriales bacterium]|nr:ATP synthase F1 subunit delta [Flavobacteriales bacterium]
MAQTKVATRYAKSLLDLVAEKGNLEEAFNDMTLVKKTCSENRDLVVLLKSPVVNVEKKVSILTAIYEKNVSKVTMLFIALITKNRRESALPEIADAFIAQYKVMKGITTAVVTSATVLADDAKKKLQDLVQKEVGGTVELQTEINPELIGGFILRIGDKQLDTSILNKIADLRQEFSSNSFAKAL